MLSVVSCNAIPVPARVLTGSGDATVEVVSHDCAGGSSGLRPMLEARRLSQVNLDVVSGPRDVPHYAREPEATEVAAAKARQCGAFPRRFWESAGGRSTSRVSSVTSR